VFKDGKPGKIAYYGEGAPLPTGTVLTVAFTLKGQDFRALNGGPVFKFTEAVSFMVDCQDQAEIDYFWDRLVEGGGEHSVCGWLKDRYGVSWPVAPHNTGDLISGPKRDKVTAVMMTMSRLTWPGWK